jgi:hypothetical protein
LFISKYGNPMYAGTENEKFANYFKDYASKILLTPVMNTLAVKASGSFVTNFVTQSCLAYVSAASEMSPTYKMIKPHMEFILFRVIFPCLCLSENDLELFTSDPIEFVRRVHTPLEEWLDLRVAAITLLQNLGRYRLKDTMPKLLPFLQGVLNEYRQIQLGAVVAPGPVDYRRKEGCLVALSSLSNLLMEKPAYKAELEPLIINHVLPEFRSPVGYMRSRACMFMENFHDIEWRDPNLVQSVLAGLLACLRDPCLPVQTSAACTLRLYLSDQSARPMVIPILPDIVREYFRIMSEVENDVILSALQTIVMEFGDEIHGIAVMIVSELLSAFSYYSKQGEEDDEAAFSAAQCLDTVSAVLEVVHEKPDILRQIEALLMPLIVTTLIEEQVEYVDNVVDILGYLTFGGDGISTDLWRVCGPLLVALSTWAADYIVEVSTTLMNFIAKVMQRDRRLDLR